MTAPCAHRTAGVDVDRSLQIARVEVEGDRTSQGRAKMASDAIRLAVPNTGFLNPVFRRSFNSYHRADVGAMSAVRCIRARN